MKARLIDVTPDEYHALPGFSSSLAKELIAKSPMHARYIDLNRGDKPSTKAMDLGDTCHAMMLGRGKRIARLPFDSWRTDKSKAERDRVREVGYVPMLAEKYDEAEAMCRNVTMRLSAEYGIDLNGKSEQAMLWTETTLDGDIDCRGMMDHLWIGHGLVLDLKFVQDASMAAVERQAENLGYAIQRAAYASGLGKVLPELRGRVQFRFLFVEVEPPYATNLVEPDGAFAELGEQRWRRALNAWARCVSDNHWPAYGTGINRIGVPQWALNREIYS